MERAIDHSGDASGIGHSVAPTDPWDLKVGMEVEGFFYPEGSQDRNDGTWWQGEVVRVKEGGAVEVRFVEDGEEHEYEEGLKDGELRLACGPWQSWFDEYLPGLVLSAFRAARRYPDRRGSLNVVLDPQTFCNMARDCDLSIAGTPQAGRGGEKRRRGP
jgi:hypothetical protein